MNEAKAARDINMGRMYPYDTDTYYEKLEDAPKDNWSRIAALGILHDLNDRKGIKQGLKFLNRDTREEIVQAMEDIILVAKKYYETNQA